MVILTSFFTLDLVSTFQLLRFFSFFFFLSSFFFLSLYSISTMFGFTYITVLVAMLASTQVALSAPMPDVAAFQEAGLEKRSPEPVMQLLEARGNCPSKGSVPTLTFKACYECPKPLAPCKPCHPQFRNIAEPFLQKHYKKDKNLQSKGYTSATITRYDTQPNWVHVQYHQCDNPKVIAPASYNLDVKP